MNKRPSYRDQRFSSTSYGCLAPMAGRPPGLLPIVPGHHPPIAGIITELWSWRNGLRPNDLPEFVGAAPGNWRQRQLPGNPWMAGRCQSLDWRRRCTAPIAGRRPVRARSCPARAPMSPSWIKCEGSAKSWSGTGGPRTGIDGPPAQLWTSKGGRARWRRRSRGGGRLSDRSACVTTARHECCRTDESPVVAQPRGLSLS
jgi:hypothetical protein